MNKYNVKVTLINPGFVQSPITDKNDFKVPFLVNTEDAANKIYTEIINDLFAEQGIGLINLTWDIPYGAEQFKIYRDNEFIGIQGHNTVKINSKNHMQPVLKFGYSNSTRYS